ncbi:PDZ domain-containing protein [Streptomyces sp. NPDC059900]|uniref:PDZ domain-containing protein n=1 Tax=Streptomyces sp. NPDC059900 TaxID=3155816 RepID=UPI0034258D15
MDQTALRPKPMPGQEHGSGGKFGGSGKFGGGGKFGRGAVPGVRRKLGIGRKPGAGRTPGTGRVPGPGHRPHAVRRRGRRLVTLIFGLLFSVVLVLSGVGLGTVSATVIGMSKLADMQKQAQAQGGAKGQGGAGGQDGAPGGASAPGTASGPAAPPGTRPGPPQKQQGEQPGKAAGRAAARPALGVEAVDAPGGSGALLVGVHSPGPGHSAGLVRGDVLLALGRTRIASAKALAAAVAAADPGKNLTVTVRHAGGQRQSLSVTPGYVT